MLLPDLVLLAGSATKQGWAAALIRALELDPKVPNRQLNILLLGEFNTVGPDNMNIAFARILYRAVTEKGFYVVFVVAQNEKLPVDLCDLNNRVRITALSLACKKSNTPAGEASEWASMLWGCMLLIKYLEVVQVSNHFV
jgi:hypothetical protein